MAIPDKPLTRRETYYAAIAGQAVQLPAKPLTREEAYLDEIARNGGGGGTGDGDMKKAVYDGMLIVQNAGGIPDYVEEAITEAIKGKADKSDLPDMSNEGYLVL